MVPLFRVGAFNLEPKATGACQLILGLVVCLKVIRQKKANPEGLVF
jgi:hypothetical protein